ncbi:MAG: hypothetical protein IT558_03790 [Alphaproteobacteria bacterium]|nr:hypothetical protein [Alphaproteobacteria bacterium]
MIDRLSRTPPVPGPADTASLQPGRKVLRMVSGSRTAGSIPVWETAYTPRQRIEENLSLAQAGGSTQADAPATLAYRPVQAAGPDEEFGFGDILDMVNPLQHLPVISHVYRSLTGDRIKPASEVIGGAIFGGAAGAAGSLVNIILEKETGKDVTGHAVALFTKGEIPHLVKAYDDPEARLSMAGQPQQEDMAAAVLAFTDLGSHSYYREEKRPVWERQ